MYRAIQNVSPVWNTPSGANKGLDAVRRLQADHDAKVVREIIAGCQILRQRRQVYLTSWLYVLAQALASAILRK